PGGRDPDPGGHARGGGAHAGGGGGPDAAARPRGRPRRGRCRGDRSLGYRSRSDGRRVTVRVGVVGVGALGQHHARVYADLPGARLAGVYDVDPARAVEVAGRHGVPAFPDLRELAGHVDAISVAVPTVDHHRVARALLEAGKDVLVEKPMTARLEEAEDLI